MVMMSPDGRYVVTGGTRANKAYIIDTRTLQLVKTIPVDIAPEHLAFSPDGRWYYQGNPDGDSISVIDMQSLSKIKTIPGFVEPLNVTFTPDGSKAYVGNYGAHWVGVIDVRRHELLKRIHRRRSRRCQARSRQVPRRDQRRHRTPRSPTTADTSMRPTATWASSGSSTRETIGSSRSFASAQDPWRIYMSHDGRYGITVEQRRRDHLHHRYRVRTAWRRRSRPDRT